MKTFSVHTTNKYSKRNKKRRNAMKNTVSRDRIPPQIFGTHVQNYDILQRISNNQIMHSMNGHKIPYPENLAPPIFSTQLCCEIMALVPYNNNNQNCHDVKNKMIRKNSTLLARLTMNALSASETDVTAILKLVETMYSSIQVMLQEVKQKQQMYKPLENKKQECIRVPKYGIKIDLKKFIKYLNDLYIRSHSEIDPQTGSNQAQAVQVPNVKQPSLSHRTNKCKSFNIILKPRCMCFSMSVCKFNSCSMDFFQQLTTFYKSCNMSNTTKRKDVPSVFIRDWHFKNVSQGYLLSALLRHNNVISLNVMRKLYFVIITSITPNLTIEINFKLANGIFIMTYDPPPFEKFSLKVIHWNDRHRSVLESSSKMPMPAFSYNTPQRNDDLKYDIKRDTKSENTIRNRSSSDSSSTLKYESSSEYEGSDYFIRSTYRSTSGFLDLKSTESSTNLTLRESVKTLTISLDESYNVLLNNRKDCGDMNFTNIFHEQYNFTIHHSRTWMSKVLRETCKLQSELVMPYLHSVMNETVFDRVTVSLGDYGCALTKYCTGFGSRAFCKILFKNLGSYIVHALFLSILYH